MQGYTDSVALEIDNSILAKLSLIGVVEVAKNGLIFDENLLNEFIENRATKSRYKQIRELKNLYSYLAILHTQTGLKYKLMQHKRAKSITITFQGLKQYTESSKLMEYDLKEFLKHFKAHTTIKRLDVAIDSKKPFNIKEIALNTKREACNKWNTIYFKTPKEKRINRHLNIKHYYKEIAQLYRLEFSFSKRYFQKQEPFKDIENTIKKALNNSFKFENIFYLIS